MIPRIAIAIALAGLALLQAPAAQAAPTTQIVSAANGLCLGVAGGSTASTTPVVQMACGGAATNWTLQAQGNGNYNVVSQASGMCLNVNGGIGGNGTTLIQYPCSTGVLNAQWSAALVGNNYRLVSLGSGLCVNVPNGSAAAGTQLIQWTCQGAAALNDQWKLTVPAVPTTITLMGASSSLCMGVPGGSTTPGADVTQASCNGGADRTWKVQPVAGGYIQVVLQSSGMCLNVYGGNGVNGTKLIQWPCQTNGALNDHWTMVPAASGYRLVSRGSGLCANVSNNSQAAGAAIVQWPCGDANATNDQFKAMAAVTPPATLPSAWSNVIPLAVNPVGAATLPNGKVMMWSANGLFSFQGDVGYGNTQTYYALFDPANNSSSQQLETSAGADMFCPGTAMLPDGRLMVHGGSSSPKTSIYEWRTNTWSAAATMQVPRGYQGSTLLSNGNVFTLGGSWSGGLGGKVGETWNANTGWTRLNGVPTDNVVGPDPQGIVRADNHLWLIAQAGGNVFHAGPSAQMNWISTSGNGSIQSAGQRGVDTYSINGNAVLYDVGKILKIAGAPAYQQNYAQPTYANNAAYTIDITKGFGQAPVVNEQASLFYPRAMNNAVVLPTGQVVVVGGQSIPQPFTDTSAVLTPEIWDPATGAWNLLAPMKTPRTYHSTALLLQDGRVFVGGGGLCGNGCAQNHADAEILTPPYLLNANGTPATRPVIQSAPGTATRGSSITVTTNSAVGSFALVRLSAGTHSTNNDQRRVPLAATAAGANTYRLAIPADPGIVLPGYYMLFAMNASRVPSVAAIVQVP